MRSRKQQARIAGVLYLLLGIFGAFGLMYVPSQIMVEGDAAATAQNLLDSELIYRAGIVSHLIGQTAFLFLALALYRLFSDVNKLHARTLLALVLVAVPIAFLNELNHVAALMIQSNFTDSFDPAQRNTFSMLFLNMYESGISVVEIFWGLWLLPFGLLVYQSGFIPKVFGILLIVACFGYLAESFVSLLGLPGYDTVSTITSITGTVGEISILLWLLIVGVKRQEQVSV